MVDRWLTRNPAPWFLVALALAAVSVGLVATRNGYAAFEFRAAAVALASGWLMAGCGLVAWWRAPASRAGALVVSAGLVSFLPPLAAVAGPGTAAAAPALSLLPAAILLHATLTVPTGRAGDPRLRLIIGLVYTAALVASPDRVVAFAAAAGITLVVRQIVWPVRAYRGSAATAGAMVVLGLAADAIPTGMVPLQPHPVTLVPAALAAAAVLLCVAAVRSRAVPARITDMVLALDQRVPTSLLTELRQMTGDRSLEVGYRRSSGSGFVDAGGRPFTPPPSDGNRVVTTLDGGDAAVVVVTDGRALDANTGFREAIGRAAEMTAENVRLLDELREEAAAVRASRSRLLEVAQSERRALRDRLQAGLEPRLAAVEAAIGPASDGGDRLGGPGQENDLERTRQGLADIRAELELLVDGMFPRALEREGLEGALRALAARSPVRVVAELVDIPTLPPALGATAWFATAEALTNVAKHAHATEVRLDARIQDDQLLLSIADDGDGQADAERGTGLRGIRDRVEAMGGQLHIGARPGQGTTIVVHLPLHPDDLGVVHDGP